MDPILQTLLSWQFILFGLAIAAIVYVVRKIIEFLMDTYTSFSKESKLWNLILTILPIFLGPLVAGLVKTLPYPNGLSTTGARIIFGLVAGLMSTTLYRVVNDLLGQKIVSIIQSVINSTGGTNTTSNIDVTKIIEDIPQDQLPKKGQI